MPSDDASQLQASVLVADDDPVYAAMLKCAFERLGFRTIVCGSGRQAWAVLQENRDVLLAILNWLLPDLDGHWIVRQPQNGPPWVFTVLMAGRSLLPEMWTELDIQVDCILAKPFTQACLDDLLPRVVQLAVARHNEPGPLESPA